MVPAHLSQPVTGVQKGFRESTIVKLPNLITGNPGSTPAAYSLSSLQLPLPSDLHPRTLDNRVSMLDTGMAKLRINA